MNLSREIKKMMNKWKRMLRVMPKDSEKALKPLKYNQLMLRTLMTSQLRKLERI